MDIEPGDRYGSKRIHQRMGPSNSGGGGGGDRYNKVCFHWQAGRCNRHPCPYLHSELPQSLDSGAKRAHHQNPPQGLVWRNPNTGGNPAPPSKWGKDRGGANGGLPRPQVNKLCNYFIAGNCSYGERCKFLHSWFVSDSFSLLTPLQGHQKVITGIALPSGSDKLYSGSKDETVRVWDCQSGQVNYCLDVFKW